MTTSGKGPQEEDAMYRILTTLLQPYTLLLLFMALAVVSLWWKRRETRRRLLILTILFASLIILSTPVVGNLTLRSLEDLFPPLEQRPTDAEIIVVLAGGVRISDDDTKPTEPDVNTLERCRHAADLYRRGPACRILASGGKVDSEGKGPAFAEVMRDLLVQLNVKVTDVIVEGASRTTFENAVECRKLLDQLSVRKIVLVTDAVHMNRALACFRKQGLEVVPAPCHFQAEQLQGSLQDFLPDPNAIQACGDATHEWLGMAWYWLQGKL
jgi:uncharacterized SAM-binding protein YcdF (DUF218 family)